MGKGGEVKVGVGAGWTEGGWLTLVGWEMKKEHPVGSSISEILMASSDSCSCT